ncbi:histidinol dehydrogenase [Pontiella sulfatireligans]|uniref:Histidinol dehydrogenase n=1 Tax=Pontiella sulfatireligans TaxID=2750658 RepID=A0A6C2UIU5_9BACT|nr:histidinol dehydrogenase [Pontiella sulfatireligans]VGO20142.1 Histidinol dehydrogenase [Pontiella sulfatireligans]
MSRNYAPIVKWGTDKKYKKVENFLLRPSVEEKAMEVATRILARVKESGDKAVIDCARLYDGSNISTRRIRVSPEEIAEANKLVDKAFKKAAKEAHKRITAFSKNGLRDNWKMATPKGGMLGEKFVPFDRVGAYIPGGAAPLASTALMTLTLAKVAGVKELVACSPAGKDGKLNPYIIYALDLAGATEIYKIGGVHAIGAMAYGTKSIAKVRKIVGPGGPYVTAAKRLVYGDVALDMVAGPSEIAVLCDTSAKPAHVAADLLSQAEHGTGSEKAMLITTTLKQAEAVRAEVLKQAKELSRAEPVAQVLGNGMLLVVVKDLADGMKLSNLFAPEHMELIVKSPEKWADKVVNAGALFIGEWTPESVGDFAAGPSHVLPTGGTAAYFSGLTVEDFRRRVSLIQFTKEDLQDVLPVVEAFGRVETLDGHARSATIRFE